MLLASLLLLMRLLLLAFLPLWLVLIFPRCVLLVASFLLLKTDTFASILLMSVVPNVLVCLLLKASLLCKHPWCSQRPCCCCLSVLLASPPLLTSLLLLTSRLLLASLLLLLVREVGLLWLASLLLLPPAVSGVPAVCTNSKIVDFISRNMVTTPTSGVMYNFKLCT